MKVSIAMATFNGQDYIEQQLNSIFSQTVLPDEIVICDDGSTDSTYEICSRLAASAPFSVKIFRNAENLGYTKNFEKALSLCSGEIIFFSDQDDVWYPEKIQKMLEPFKQDNDVGLVYSDALVVDEKLESMNVTVFSTRGQSEIWKGEDRDPIDVIKNPNIKGCTLAFS